MSTYIRRSGVDCLARIPKMKTLILFAAAILIYPLLASVDTCNAPCGASTHGLTSKMNCCNER
ncbi:hypothetical protein BC940DRAFT_311346 [Gongronella butleri]|nr:hypothetical protein BC940DRAFT_311346 [Gongronella butleri]